MNAQQPAAAPRSTPSRISAAQRVLEHLRSQIIQAELKPGTLLLEPELAQQYGVSKTPTREALQILVAEGLVTVIPRRGYYVSTVSFHDFREAMELRLIIEPQLAALAAQRRTADVLRELRHHLDIQFDQASTLSARLEAATLFHRTCVRASENSLASSVVGSLFTAVQRLHHLNKGVESHLRSQGERDAHEAIFAAIRDQDADLAQQLMHDHLVESNESLARSFMGSRSEA